MSYRGLLQQMIRVSLVALLLAGCGAPATTLAPEVPTATSTPLTSTATPTSEPPTASPTSEPPMATPTPEAEQPAGGEEEVVATPESSLVERGPGEWVFTADGLTIPLQWRTEGDVPRFYNPKNLSPFDSEEEYHLFFDEAITRLETRRDKIIAEAKEEDEDYRDNYDYQKITQSLGRMDDVLEIIQEGESFAARNWIEAVTYATEPLADPDDPTSMLLPTSDGGKEYVDLSQGVVFVIAEDAPTPEQMPMMFAWVQTNINNKLHESFYGLSPEGKLMLWKVFQSEAWWAGENSGFVVRESGDGELIVVIDSAKARTAQVNLAVDLASCLARLRHLGKMYKDQPGDFFHFSEDGSLRPISVQGLNSLSVHFAFTLKGSNNTGLGGAAFLYYSPEASE